MAHHHPQFFNELYNTAGGGGTARDHHVLDRPPNLNQFIRLMLVSRWLQILDGGNPALLAAATGPAEAAYSLPPWESQGALIAVSGIREEGIIMPVTNSSHYTQAQFNAILQWAIAHEIGHLEPVIDF